MGPAEKHSWERQLVWVEEDYDGDEGRYLTRYIDLVASYRQQEYYSELMSVAEGYLKLVQNTYPITDPQVAATTFATAFMIQLQYDSRPLFGGLTL